MWFLRCIGCQRRGCVLVLAALVPDSNAAGTELLRASPVPVWEQQCVGSLRQDGLGEEILYSTAVVDCVHIQVPSGFFLLM